MGTSLPSTSMPMTTVSDERQVNYRKVPPGGGRAGSRSCVVKLGVGGI